MKRNVFSVVGFWLSMLTFVMDYGYVGSLVGFSLCVAGYTQCQNEPNKWKGKGFGIAGFVIIILTLLFIIATAMGLLSVPSVYG